MATSTKTKPDPVTDAPVDELAVTAPTVGQWLTVLVHPGRNDGSVTAPAIVTGVLDDVEGRPAVNVRAFLHSDIAPLAGVLVFADEAAARAYLETQFELLPGHTRDATGTLKPGRNILLPDPAPWEWYDILLWIAVAFPAS